jgi:hypothetical protein
MQGVSKSALHLLKLTYISPEDMYSVLNFHNVAKHTEFYLDSYGSLWLTLVIQSV